MLAFRTVGQMRLPGQGLSAIVGGLLLVNGAYSSLQDRGSAPTEMHGTAVKRTNSTRGEYVSQSPKDTGKLSRRRIGEKCEENPTENRRSHKIDIEHGEGLLVSIGLIGTLFKALALSGEGT